MPDADGYLTDNEILHDGVVWKVREQDDPDWLCEAWIDTETECPETAVVELQHWDADYYCTQTLCQKHFEELKRR